MSKRALANIVLFALMATATCFVFLVCMSLGMQAIGEGSILSTLGYAVGAGVAWMVYGRAYLVYQYVRLQGIQVQCSNQAKHSK